MLILINRGNEGRSKRLSIRHKFYTLDELFAKLKERFSDRQIVDLTMRLALCSAWNAFNDALQLDTESPVQHAFAELGLQME